MSGGRNKQEMQNTEKITKGATAYLTQLDALAEITGQSREEQEKAMKEASGNAAYEAMMQGLDEEGKKKATLAMQNALATGGKAGADLLKSQMLGLPPMTEAAQKLQALGPNVAAGIKQMGDAVNDTSKTMKDVEKGRAAAQVGASQDADRLGKGLLSAMSFMSGPDAQLATSLQKSDNINKQQGIKTQEDAENQMKSVTAKQKERQASEAADAVKTQKAVQELGQEIMAALLPVIRLLTPIMNAVVGVFSSIAKVMGEFKAATIGLVAALAVYWAAQKYQNIMGAVNKAKAAGGKGALGGLGIAGALGMVGALGSESNPMWVRIKGGGAGSSILDQVLDTEKSGGKAGGKAGKLGKFGKIAGGIGGLAGGLALDYAGDKLRESGHEKLGATAGIGSAALTGAGMGAMLGPLGALAGGLAGGAYGLYQNWDTLAGKTPTKMALGGIVNKPTTIEAGEAGPEVISPLKNFESLQTELQTLNKVSADILKYLKETAENTKRNVDATKSLNGDLFSF
jgi:hypothetical protein